jgi:hypothetical protein
MLPADEMFQQVWSTKKSRMSKADRELLEQLVEQYRFDILREWEEKVNPNEG